MKQLKFLTMALLMVVGLTTLTSCFDSDGDSTERGVAIARVTSSMGLISFRTSTGTMISPTQASLTEMEANGTRFSEMQGDILYIMYEWDSEVQQVADDAKEISGVDLIAWASMESPVEIVESEGAVNDSVANASVIALGSTSESGVTQTGEAQTTFFDANTLLLPINYYYDYNGRMTHSFTLVYYPNDEETRNVPTFYLRHNQYKENPTPGSTNNSNYLALYGGYLFYYVRAFDMTAALNRYRRELGLEINTPITTVQIYADTSTIGVSLSNSTRKSYIYNYSSSSSTGN